ncbi:MAG: hypothetical protein A3F72_01700 [Bacteroidetes bacterium RIFCSPLOWO2_12_FULL_35_15]|nr:MAG: hypothetical protein A3F72_01700 [Bacteroidetes bacterium RIFCSPLOWO2_12_FULL_35_15]
MFSKQLKSKTEKPVCSLHEVDLLNFFLPPIQFFRIKTVKNFTGTIQIAVCFLRGWYRVEIGMS